MLTQVDALVSFGGYNGRYHRAVHLFKPGALGRTPAKDHCPAAWSNEHVVFPARSSQPADLECHALSVLCCRVFVHIAVLVILRWPFRSPARTQS